MEAIKEALGVGRFASVAECVEAARALSEKAWDLQVKAECAERELAGLREETGELFAEALERAGYSEDAVRAARAQWVQDPKRAALALLGCDVVEAAGCNQHKHKPGCEKYVEIPEAAEKLMEKFEDGFFQPITEGMTEQDRFKAWWDSKLSYLRSEDKEGKKDAAPFYEMYGEVYSLIPTRNMKTWEDAFSIIHKKRREIREEWEQWKNEVLEVLREREKPSVYENIKKSLEEYDGVRSAVLKKRIADGVIRAPQYMTATEREKAWDKVGTDYRDKANACKEAHDMYYFYKRDQIRKLMEEVGFTEVQAENSKRSGSIYLTGKTGNVYAKVRLSDHNYPGINYYHRGANAQLRVWQTREEFKKELEALKKRFDEGDYSEAPDNLKKPDGF